MAVQNSTVHNTVTKININSIIDSTIEEVCFLNNVDIKNSYVANNVSLQNVTLRDFIVFPGISIINKTFVNSIVYTSAHFANNSIYMYYDKKDNDVFLDTNGEIKDISSHDDKALLRILFNTYRFNIKKANENFEKIITKSLTSR